MKPAPEVNSRVNGERTADTADECVAFLRDYAGRRLNSRLADARRSFPPYVVLDLGRNGILGLRVPGTLSGLGLSWRATGRVMRQLGAIDLTLATFVGIHNELGIGPILEWGSVTARDELLPDLARGRRLGGFAITESGAGSNPRAIKTTATLLADSTWQLEGSKTWVGNGSWAGVLNVFARTHKEGRPGGIVGFIVQTDQAGVSFGPEAMTMGMRGIVQCSVKLADVRVRPEYILGTADADFVVADRSFCMARLGIAMTALGAMKRCTQLLLRNAGRRRISTGLILENIAFQTTLASTLYSSLVVERLCDLIADGLDRAAPVPRELFFACKILAPEYLYQTADSLVQWLGGRGYIESNEAPQILRDARLFRIFEGPTETMRTHLGAVLRSSKALLDFLNLWKEGEAACRRLSEAWERIWEVPYPDGVPISAHLAHVNAIIGEVAAKGLAWWLLTVQPAGEAAQRWAEGCFDDAVRMGLRSLAVKVDLQTSSLADALQADIGDIRQLLPGEDWELDPQLAP